MKSEELQKVLLKHNRPNSYEVRIAFKSELPLTLEQAQAVVIASIKTDRLYDDVFVVYTVPGGLV